MTREEVIQLWIAVLRYFLILWIVILVVLELLGPLLVIVCLIAAVVDVVKKLRR